MRAKSAAYAVVGIAAYLAIGAVTARLAYDQCPDTLAREYFPHSERGSAVLLGLTWPIGLPYLAIASVLPCPHER